MAGKNSKFRKLTPPFTITITLTLSITCLMTTTPTICEIETNPKKVVLKPATRHGVPTSSWFCVNAWISIESPIAACNKQNEKEMKPFLEYSALLDILLNC